MREICNMIVMGKEGPADHFGVTTDGSLRQDLILFEALRSEGGI